ncbi:glyoxylase-like metal-dependent hydrolase (beta-lactamase superfamily II) [Sphingomonas jinjuensis]|uniref:Glyoxylase-like metal-dependent hydrolase (Beta-lactamase superfamily II) n=1 Tax=Sphingomonas jinjuensis TaxID=535907 RepID=A0A840FLY3_9SPHN|nr:MBL fold metallo-hydrolase [Sphingomonas jinjuensis]MBB4154938.1 glyoxylase-like metal-dependent hydrolase (beta-lactamase superfamily II) [Sphingomonas jinjuensis]
MATAPIPSPLAYPFGDAFPATGARMRVAEGIEWVRMPVPGPLRHVNCWLLADEGGVAVVDTGFNTDATRAAWGLALPDDSAVTGVIGTHMHPDHVGLAGWLCERHGCGLTMTRGEWLTLRMLVADASEAVPEAMIALWHGAGWSEAEIEVPRSRGWARFRSMVAPVPMSYRRIVDGDRLTVGRTTWRIVVGSGHSPEHACLLDEANGVLIAGDQVLPRISPNVSLGVTEPEADPLGEWFASIDKLRGLPDGLLVLPGHGEPFTGLHARLDAMEAEHRARLDGLEALLRMAPRRAVDAFATLFSRPIGDDMRGMATGEALAHLRRLEVEGRAQRAMQDGVWWWQVSGSPLG